MSKNQRHAGRSVKTALEDSKRADLEEGDLKFRLTNSPDRSFSEIDTAKSKAIDEKPGYYPMFGKSTLDLLLTKYNEIHRTFALIRATVSYCRIKIKIMYSVVDLEEWNRKSTYEFFKDYADPFFNFTANLDVTRLYRFCKDHELSFALAALYYSLAAANEIREFRIRICNDSIVEFEHIHATQTILNSDDTFSFAYFEMKKDVFDFVRDGREALEKYKHLRSFDVESNRLDLIYCSVIPWVSFTSFKHASRLDKTQTIPRVVFGKHFDANHGKLMPLSVEANHAIMDGVHVGKFFNRFQDSIDSI